MSDLPAPGTAIGPYTVERVIGEGGLGVVVQAVDPSGHRLALKTLRPGDHAGRAWLHHEFRAIAELSHPHLVEFYELGEQHGTPYVAMELVAGPDVVTWMSDPGRSEADRRRVAGELASALAYLHEHGIVHQDVKPANALVRANGTVALLDFELSLASTPGFSDGRFSGTLHWAAPELLLGEPPSPAADLWSLGALLHAAYLGGPPHGGSITDRVDGVRVGLPVDLDGTIAEMLSGLLEPVPSARWGHVELAAALGLPVPAADAPRFYGRTDQLADFAGILRGVRQGSAALVRVEAPSGVGKSALLARLVELARAEGAATLTTRLYAGDTAGFRTLDGILGEASSLATLAGDDHTLRPAFARLAETIPRLRPIYGNLRASAAPSALALAEVFAWWTRAGPLVLAVDDAQWADVDSARLLADAIAPGGPVVVLAACQTGVACPFLDTLVEGVAERGGSLSSTTWSLDVLGADALAEALPGADRDALGAVAEALARAPFLLPRLLSGEDPARASSSLQSELDALSADSRRVLELACVAVRPVRPVHLMAAARPETGPVIRPLTGRRLLAVDGARALTVAHAGIREAVLRTVAPESVARHHADLADVFADVRPVDDALLALHRHGAGDDVRAIAHALRASEAAEAVGAADAALSHLQDAIAWGAADPDGGLVRRRAHLLSLAARHEAAAHAWRRVADDAVDEEERIEALNQVARSQLLAGLLHEGRSTLAVVLASRRGGRLWTGATAMLAALGGLAWMGLRGWPLGRSRQVLGPAIDTCWSAGTALSAMLPGESMALIVRSLRLALRSGDELRAGRAFGMTAVVLAALGGWGRRQSEVVLTRARATAERFEDAGLLATLDILGGYRDAALGRWPEANAQVARGVEALDRLASQEFAWERSMARATELYVLDATGEFGQVDERVRAWLPDVLARGDRYASVAYLQFAAFAALTHGDVDRATRLADQAERLWVGTGYGVQEFATLRLRVFIALAAGNLAEASARFAADLPRVRAAGLHRINLSRIALLQMEALIALRGGAPTDRQRASKLAAGLRAESRPDAVLLGRALALTLTEDHAGADRLAADYEALGMPAYADLVRVRFADDAAARARLVARGLTRPDDVVTLLLPGVPRGAGQAPPGR